MAEYDIVQDILYICHGSLNVCHTYPAFRVLHLLYTTDSGFQDI